MRNGQCFTVVRDLIGKRTRLRRAKVNGQVRINAIGQRRFREWQGWCELRKTKANYKAAMLLLKTGSIVSLRGIGDVLLSAVNPFWSQRHIRIELLSTGVFTVPGGKSR